MAPPGAERYNGLLHCLRGTVRRHGVRGLYSGLYANLVQCLPASAIGYVAYEHCKTMLGAYRPRVARERRQ